MVFHLPNYLSAEAVFTMRSALSRASWVDGHATAMGAAAEAKLIVQEGSAIMNPSCGSVVSSSIRRRHSIACVPSRAATRISAFFSVQNLVRDDDARRTPCDLEELANRVVRGMPTHLAGVELLAIHDQLLRRCGAT